MLKDASTSAKIILTIGIAGMNAISYFWGPLDSLLIGLFFFAVVDLITGMGGALLNGTYSAEKFTLRKKIGIAIAVAVIYRVDQLFPTLQDVVPAFESWMQPLRDTCISFFIVNEIISIFENLGDWGIHLPKFITDRIEKLKQQGEKLQIKIAEKCYGCASGSHSPSRDSAPCFATNITLIQLVCCVR